jgi:hypothetical protein
LFGDDLAGLVVGPERFHAERASFPLAARAASETEPIWGRRQFRAKP